MHGQWRTYITISLVMVPVLIIQTVTTVHNHKSQFSSGSCVITKNVCRTSLLFHMLSFYYACEPYLWVVYVNMLWNIANIVIWQILTMGRNSHNINRLVPYWITHGGARSRLVIWCEERLQQRNVFVWFSCFIRWLSLQGALRRPDKENDSMEAAVLRNVL